MGTDAENKPGNEALTGTAGDTSGALPEAAAGENGGVVSAVDTAGGGPADTGGTAGADAGDAAGAGTVGAAAAGVAGADTGGTGGGGTQEDWQQTIGLASALVVTTIAVLGVWFYAVRGFDNASQVEITIPWSRPPELRLQPGPAHFLYDEDTKQLRHLGLIDDGLKTQLIALPGKIADGNQALQQAADSYVQAINQLAYKSEMTASKLFVFSLLLGGLSGLLGVQLRSVTNFVGVRCFSPDKWNFSRWWPWYVMRPVAGFLLGVVLILVVEGGLFTTGEVTSAKLSWRLGVAFLAGFGATDFTDKLRLVAQTLFGGAPPKPKPQGGE